MQYQTINPAIIQENLMNDTELILEFLALYIEQIPADVLALKEAIASEVITEITSKAHHIKPTMEYIGATDLREQFQKLEDAGKSGADISLIKASFLTIENTVETLLNEIETYRSTL